MPRQRLLLVGGGHAHLHVLAQAARAPLPGVEITLVSPAPYHHYSGMVPGFLAGRYEEAELKFDLRALADAARARFVERAVGRVDAGARVALAGEESLPFDLLSLDVGSAAAGLAVPGAREHAFAPRPMHRAVALRRHAETLFGRARDRRVAVVVVGGGAAGIEVALALESLGRRRGARPEVTILEAGASVLGDFSPQARRLTTGVLAERGIALRCGASVAAVEAGGVRLATRERLPSELTVWLAGAAPPPLLAGSDLPLDRRGFLLVDETLRAVDGAPVFGAGDCISIEGHPNVPKAGVYAVRAAPVLDHNLRAALTGGRPLAYRPQASFLSLLATADGRANWRWRRWSGRSRAAWWLKDKIDRRFVRRYQRIA